MLSVRWFLLIAKGCRFNAGVGNLLGLLSSDRLTLSRSGDGDLGLERRSVNTV